jgi:hypothetical protein
MKLKENLTDDFKQRASNYIMNQSNISSSPEGSVTGFQTINKLNNELTEKKMKNKPINKGVKKSNITDLVGKGKMDLPIGKLYSIGKSQTNEDKRAKEQFKLDLKNDPDFQDIKKDAGEFGTPNVSLNDPFIKKKKYKHIPKIEKIDEEWSEKYKKSIDCKNPKGFSQKAHCQGRKKKGEQSEATGAGSAGGFMAPVGFDPNSDFVKRSFSEKPKKVETKEATGVGSSGSYETTGAWAKSTKKKDWRGASKPQIPGGKFVQVKKKCKKFPYCNQGDINALNIWENETLKKVISNVSQKYNISENVVKNIIAYEYDLIKR